MRNYLIDTKWHQVDATRFGIKAARKRFIVETCRLLSNQAELVADVYLRKGRPELMITKEDGDIKMYEAEDAPLTSH